MKRKMMVVAVVMCMLLITMAHAEDVLWACPNCCSLDNSGEFCGYCGEKKPERLFYILPMAAMGEDGRMTILWEDADSRPPYTVCYMYGTDRTSQDLFLEEDEVTSYIYTFDSLIPGNQYTIVIYDADNQVATSVFTVPEAEEFKDGDLNMSSVDSWIEPICKARSEDWTEAVALPQLNASEMVNNWDTHQYAIVYSLDHGVLSSPREYFTQCVIYAPNGYVWTVVGTDVEYGNDDSDGFTFTVGVFDRIYNSCGTIPSGTWTVELYWNGMLANRNTFTVQ